MLGTTGLSLRKEPRAQLAPTERGSVGTKE